MGIVHRSRGAPRSRAFYTVEPLEERRLLSVTLVSDINASAPGVSSSPANFVNLNGTLLFRTTSGTQTGLYRSDGTAAGTQLLTTIPIYSNLFPLGRQALFFSGTDLWATDGTAAGTRMVKSIGVTSYQMVEMGGALYFCDNSNATTLRLWRSDGTATGTVLVKTITEANASPKNHQLTRLGNSLYFVAWSPTTSSKYNIYKSDGTTPGTTVFKSVLSDFGTVQVLHVRRLPLLLTGDYPTYTGTRTLRTDGTTTSIFSDGSGTPVLINDVYGTIGDDLYLNAGGIWKTDGTPSGTTRLGTYYPSTFYQSQAVVGDTLFLEGNTTFGGDVELVKTSGIDVTVLKNINVNDSSYPQALAALRQALFIRLDGVHGYELWHSDGTADGTVLDTDIFPGNKLVEPDHLLDIGGTLFFSATDAAHGNELFKITTPLAAPLGLCLAGRRHTHHADLG